MDTLQGATILNCQGKRVEANDVVPHKNLVVYYFSASWCEPCAELLPKLRKIYEESLKRQTNMIIILVSADTDENAFLKHFMEKHCGWFAIPLDEPVILELRHKYNISHIPEIIVVKTDGTIITRRGKKEVEEKGLNVLITWVD